MTSTASGFVTVDMRGLKAVLVERARRNGISVSALIRGAVAARLGFAAEAERTSTSAIQAKEGTVRLSLHLSSSQATSFQASAAAAGLSRRNYLATLMANAPRLPTAA